VIKINKKATIIIINTAMNKPFESRIFSITTIIILYHHPSSSTAATIIIIIIVIIMIHLSHSHYCQLHHGAGIHV
jgi:hypothetical protein